MVNTLFSISLKKNIIRLLYFTLAVLTISGCSFEKAGQMKIPQPEILTAINKSITTLYPDRFKALHHVILTFSGKDYVLDGYLFIDRPGQEIKLIAQNDLGGILFEIHYIKNIEKMICSNISLLKEKLLEKSALRDLEALYLKEPFRSPELSYDSNGNLVLSQKENQITQTLLYSKQDCSTQYQLNEIRYQENNEYFYTIHLQYDTDNPYPIFILIKDTRMKYSLQINVRYFM